MHGAESDHMNGLGDRIMGHVCMKQGGDANCTFYIG